MTAAGLPAALAGDAFLGERIAHISTIRGREPQYGTLDPPLPEPLEAYCAARGIRLFTHQCAAIDAVRRGADVILTTGTASGKSLAFLLPIFERLLCDPGATALCLYPAKALAHDQLRAFAGLEGYTGCRAGAAVYDGDTPAHRRPRIRAESKIILSNPYELHQVLGWHAQWRPFLARLRTVVIDEAHQYRGVFGAHVALLLRRLMRLAQHYGARPQCILSTATLGNPAEFGFRLIGRQPYVIDSDGSPAGDRHLVLVNPAAGSGPMPSLSRTVRRVLQASVGAGLQTLCFTPSRSMAEAVVRHARDGCGAQEIAAYRAGYLPAERRVLEQKLKEGELTAVVSTNALELGIDIGSLDAVVMAGYQGSMMAFRQQAGRAGRRREASAAVLVASDNALDQYYMQHPEAFSSRPPEHAVLDTGNPYILAGHLLCAAAELPLSPDGEPALFGPGAADAAGALTAAGLLAPSRKGLIYTGRGRAVDACPLGAGSGEQYRVSCGGQLLETLDRTQAYREAHPGAILLHQGETYRVTRFDGEARAITVQPYPTDCHTRVLKSVGVAIDRTIDRRRLPEGTLSFGEVTITETFREYQLRHFDTLLESVLLALPPVTFPTRAFWVTVPGAERLEAHSCDAAGGLHGAEHALIGMMPVHVLCDRRDIGGFSSVWHPDTGAPTILVYDGYEGGIGLAEKAYARFEAIAATARSLIRACACREGCPSCIHSPQCGNDNRPLDKAAALMVLGWLAGDRAITLSEPQEA
ncbi:MAG: DEAD/DEAH box helicase [Methanomicrobiales archaeon]|nr:DEAD/DEAH box helicase [Methanomicrobiales archaeon]